MNKYDVVLFDLDGTLLDTLEDMCDSVNHVMEKFGYPVHSLEKVRSFIGNGIRKLIERALPEGTDSKTCELALAEYRRYYGENCMVKTRPYEGIPELLSELKERGFRIGVVTNKNAEAAEKLCSHYFPDTVEVVTGQKDSLPKKPDPAMVQSALEQMGVVGKKTVYIGDSETDIETAANSQMDCIICLWGFREKEYLLQKGAKTIVSQASEIADLVTLFPERQ